MQFSFWPCPEITIGHCGFERESGMDRHLRIHAGGADGSKVAALSALSVDDRGLTDSEKRLPIWEFAAHRHTFYASAPIFHHSGLS